MKTLIKQLLPAPVLGVIRKVRKQLRHRQFQATAPARIAAYLASPNPRKLNVGSGPFTRIDWLNVDFVQHNDRVVFVDCSRPLPFSDASFDYVFSEHLLEHLDYPTGYALLSEFRRILRPGGCVRIATPNLAFLIALYRPEKSNLQQRYVAWSALRWPGVAQPTDTFVINHFVRAWGHQFIYDPTTLAATLHSVGFKSIRFLAPGSSDDPALCCLEQHGDAITEEFNLLETFVIEADCS